MAFHPFKHFRKHQKVYLAITTILTMFIFVFTGFASRGADPVTRILMWIGGGRHGDKVVTLYDKNVYTDELEKLRWQRQMAHEFILFNVRAALDNPLQKSLSDIRKKYGEKQGTGDLGGPVQIALEASGIRHSRGPDAAPDRRLEPLNKTLAFLQNQLGREDIQTTADQYRALDAIATDMALQAWFVDPARRPNESYFGGSTVRTEDLLDFLIWKHQADRLGIVLAPADVCREVNRAWGNGDWSGGEGYLSPDGKLDNNAYVAEFFRRSDRIHKSLTPRDLLNALTDEFRVALAKEALLGSAPGVRSYRAAVDGIHVSPSVATPDEFYKYFQERRTTLSLSILPLAVKDFVNKVEAKPTETALRNLYERYKNDEPSPTRRQPGFKEPRRIKIESFSYRPEGPFARKLADKAIELLPVFRVGQPASAFAAGGGLAWAASLAGYADVDTAVRSLYEDYLREESRRVTVKYDRDDSTRFGLPGDFPQPRGVEVQGAAAVLGELLGGFSSGGTPLSAPTGWLAAQEMAERATVTAYASTVLAGASSSPLAAAVLPMRYHYTTQPLDAVREQMIDRFRNTLAATLMEKKINVLREELDKVLGSHSEEKLAEFLKKAIPEYGLENVHAMKEAQTRQEILDRPDAALRELRTAYEETQDNPFEMDPSRPDFVSALFHSLERNERERQMIENQRKMTDEMLRMMAQLGMKKIDPFMRSRQFRSTSGDVIWIFCRPEDQPARVRPFETIRTEVQEAWYFEQARKLARDKAQQINDELKKQNLAPDPAVQFLIQQNQGQVFQLIKVAHLLTPEFSQPGLEKSFAGRYYNYVPPKEYIPYPPADFVEQLLKLKKRGDSRVIADQPVRHFYIAVLMENPQLPERKEFYEVYNLRNQEDPLWDKMTADRQHKYAQELLAQLRAEATKDLQGGEYVLPDNVRNRSESSSDFGE